MGTAYRADHVGSFLRTPEVLAARRQQGITSEELRAVEDQSILRLLAKQKELGFEVFTDGEVRRKNFMSDFTDAVDGFDLDDAVTRQWAASGEASPSASRVAGVVVSKLKKRRDLTAEELPFLKQHSPGAIKMTLPSATQFPAISYKRGVTDSVYSTHSELLWDVVSILKDEVRMLAENGAHYIQIDAPRYSYYLDPKWREWLHTEMGVDLDTALDDDAIAEKLFSSLKVDRFLLEYDDDRSGTFEPLRFVPRGKTVVLGLVSSKVAKLEDSEQLARRIEEAARYVSLEDLALSPQCGFASTLEGNLLSENDQWAKLGCVAETARRVWGG